ncbi:hypothetical protein QJS66_03855 [Kocuria rhizophila]|nr:hypothetical protein QJS66_03855 [Kocuria rhizophila]
MLAMSAPAPSWRRRCTRRRGEPGHPANVPAARARPHATEPATGWLTGTDSGPGRLPEPQDIVDAALALASSADVPSSAGPSDAASHRLREHPRRRTVHRRGCACRGPHRCTRSGSLGALAGRRALVTAGGTREADLVASSATARRASRASPGPGGTRSGRGRPPDRGRRGTDLRTACAPPACPRRASSGGNATAAAGDVVIDGRGRADSARTAGEHKMKKSRTARTPRTGWRNRTPRAAARSGRSAAWTQLAAWALRRRRDARPALDSPRRSWLRKGLRPAALTRWAPTRSSAGRG